MPAEEMLQVSFGVVHFLRRRRRRREEGGEQTNKDSLQDSYAGSGSEFMAISLF